VMLGHYGWIMTFDDIDHADLGMTAGRVYIHKRDVMAGEPLAQGDIVSFYLYADDQGLGAECCRLERSASASMNVDANEFVPARPVATPSLRLDADEFVPDHAGSTAGLNVCASEFVPTSASTFLSGLSMKAVEFVPSPFSLLAQEFIPAPTCSNIFVGNPNVMMFNPAFLSDDESDDESSVVSNDDFSGNDGDKESNDSDEESSCDESVAYFQQKWALKQRADIAVVVHAPLKSLPALSADDSTSAGESSESDEEPLVHCAARAPPGLSLPAGWRAPPGLSLPVLVA